MMAIFSSSRITSGEQDDQGNSLLVYDGGKIQVRTMKFLATVLNTAKNQKLAEARACLEGETTTTALAIGLLLGILMAVISHIFSGRVIQSFVSRFGKKETSACNVEVVTVAVKCKCWKCNDQGSGQ